MRRAVSPAAALGATAVRGYQLLVRPLIGAHCRFLPSCSDYAIEALCSHGALRGSVLAGRRILRCNPWCEGGYDPVPAPHQTPSGPAPHGSARP
ncbi:MAG: membrane protein insertion efficiency factor YidD [Rhodospirillales bacterium]|nr:membrane protein insertion efficiency factor YidD [Rhodospirillales bacterium]